MIKFIIRKGIFMEKKQVSLDDLQDVQEIAEKIETFILQSLKDTQMDLAMSTVISAFINTITRQCHSREEIVFYRNIIDGLFKDIIAKIDYKNI